MGNHKSRYFCCGRDDLDEISGMAYAERNRLGSQSMNDSFMNTEEKCPLPTCPICLEEMECIKMRSCGHFICEECFGNYIQSVLKDISKYPLQCFLPNCDILLDYNDVTSVLLWDESTEEKSFKDVKEATNSLGLQPMKAPMHKPSNRHIGSTAMTLGAAKQREAQMDTLLYRATALSHKSKVFSHAMDNEDENNTLENWKMIDSQLDEIEQVAKQLQQFGLNKTPSVSLRREAEEDEEKQSTLECTTGGCSTRNCTSHSKSAKISAADASNRDLLLYDRFCVMASVPPNEREQCPECEMIFIKDDLERKPTYFEWIEDKQRSKCHSCDSKFHLLKRRHHCRICGDIFCKECTNRLMPLSAAHNSMIHRYFVPTKRSSIFWFSKHKQSHKNTDEKEMSDDERLQNRDADTYDSASASLLSPFQIEKASTIGVRSCYECWYNYHCVICKDCKYEYCIDCQAQWSIHYQFTVCPVALSGLTQLDKGDNNADNAAAEAERLFKELKTKEGWSECPNCGVTVIKSQGCNHMTHKRCPNPSEGDDTHFCYCCSETLYGETHHDNVHGVEHFPYGIFDKCIVTIEENNSLQSNNNNPIVQNLF